MKLYWHIGPHKTGTTSVQTAMAAFGGSGRAAYYYPPTPEFGPGHAALAWQFLGLNKHSRTPGVLLAEIERAAQLGYSKTVISSEEFSRALLTSDSFRSFAPVCEAVETEVVITLRPLGSRIHPELQELIKNGQKLNLLNAQEILDAVMTRPGLRPDFLPAAIFESGAASVSVILVDTESPTKVFEGMAAVIDEKLPIPRKPPANVSYPFVKTAWLDVLNRYSGSTLNETRAAVDAAFTAASRDLAGLAEVPYPPLPSALQRYIDGVWVLQKSLLDLLHESGRIRLL